MRELVIIDYQKLDAGPRTFFKDFQLYFNGLDDDKKMFNRSSFIGVPYLGINWSCEFVLLRINGLRFRMPFRLRNSVMKRMILRLINLPLFIRMIFASHLVFQSRASLNFWRWIFPINKKNISIIPNGISKRKVYKLAKPRKIIFAFANWRPGLCLPQIIDVMRMIQRDNPSVDCRIYGYSRDYANWFYKITQGISGSSINYCGVMDEGCMQELSRHHSIMLTLDYFSACPNAVLEALSYQIPVVGPKTLGLNEIVPAQLLFDVSFDPFDFGPTAKDSDQPVFNHEEIKLRLSSVLRNYDLLTNYNFLTSLCLEKERVFDSYLEILNDK